MESPIHTAIVRAPIDATALQARVAHPGAGGVLAFVGTVRDSKHGRRVVRIDYDAYEPMARRVLHRIAAAIVSQWPDVRIAMEHRIGRLEIGDASIVIVVASPHRDAGFAALRAAIEAVKRDLPVWKHEWFEDGAVWVQEGS
jgi:molybdopterin synthase catalytic subunit